MDRSDSTDVDVEQEFLYDYLLDSGVLNDVHAVAESIVDGSSLKSDAGSAASWSSFGSGSVDDNNDDDVDAARRIADRLLEQSAEEVERALDAIVRDVKLSAAGAGQLVDFRWPQLSDVGGGRSPRDTGRTLDALLRLPFTYDTYAGTYFRKLTGGLERAMMEDAFFGSCARVYAKLVDAAPDVDAAAESFGSLCEATHVRCLRGHDFRKSVAAVCLTVRCLSAVCTRGDGTATKNVKPAVAEFVATLAATRDRNCGPYAILCCADPEATWFDRVSRFAASRLAFFQCLDSGDRKLLKTVVGSFTGWMAEPKIPDHMDRKSAPPTAAVVEYACALHAIHLLAKTLRYRAVRAMFPVKVSKTSRINAVGLSRLALGFLSTNRDQVQTILAGGLCELVASVLAFHAEQVIDSVVENQSKFTVRILAEAVERYPAAIENVVVQREHLMDELFKRRRRKHSGGGIGAATVGSLIKIAIVLTGRSHEEIWRLVTRRMSFLEEVAAVVGDFRSSSGDCNFSHSQSCSQSKLMTNIRCTPLGTLTYDLGDFTRCDDFDWYDPQQRIVFSISCTSSPGRCWLNRTGAFDSLDRFVAACLIEAESSLDPDDNRKCVDSIVDVAYLYCASIEGLRTLLGGCDDGSDTASGSSKLTKLLCFSYDDFDGHAIARDVLIMLWLRLIKAATHAFSSRVYLDSKLKYQETLSKLSIENRTENGTVFVNETTELLAELQRPLFPAIAGLSASDSTDEEAATGRLTEFLTNVDCNSGGWLQKARTLAIHTNQISAAETMDLIISFGRRRFNNDPMFDLHSSCASDRKSSNLSDFDNAGIQLAMKCGSSAGLLSEDAASADLARLYGDVKRRGSTAEWTPFDCVTCTLFVASQGSGNKCDKALVVLLKLGETTQFIWPQFYDGDFNRRAAFGHLVEGLLQQELPEVYNAFKMSGVSWWLLCSGWASDCFWGRLSWPEICRWLCLVVLCPADYQAFFFICLAASRKRQWLEAFNLGRFRETVYQGDFYDFQLVDHANYLEGLSKKHKRSVLKKLVSEFDNS